MFNPEAFRERFPAFADATAWPEAALERGFEPACCHISPCTGKRLRGRSLALALELMTAHLRTLEKGMAAGEAGGPTGIVSSASVDKVSVTLTPPPVKSQWQWWLSLTPYGQELLALLRSKAAGGLYVGGVPAERAGFRKAGGVFENAGRSS